MRLLFSEVSPRKVRAIMSVVKPGRRKHTGARAAQEAPPPVSWGAGGEWISLAFKEISLAV